MKWLKKTAVVSCVVGVLVSFAAMVPTSHSTEAAIAVFDAKNIEEAIKREIQTAKILTEEQKQQKAIHETSKSTAQAAQQTIQLDKNMEDAKKALEASNKAEGQQQAL